MNQRSELRGLNRVSQKFTPPLTNLGQAPQPDQLLTFDTTGLKQLNRQNLSEQDDLDYFSRDLSQPPLQLSPSGLQVTPGLQMLRLVMIWMIKIG